MHIVGLDSELDDLQPGVGRGGYFGDVTLQVVYVELGSCCGDVIPFSCHSYSMTRGRRDRRMEKEEGEVEESNGPY